MDANDRLLIDVFQKSSSRITATTTDIFLKLKVKLTEDGRREA